jgi:tetratricopeptide (TPR) repeat protein
MEINSGNAHAYALQGDIYFDKKEYHLAIADYDKALAIDETNEWLYLKRANYWYVNGNFKSSIFDLEKAFKLNPSNFTVLNDFAWLLATCSDKPYRNGEKAVQLAEKAVKASRSAETLDTLAASYAEIGRFDDAVKIQEESIDIQKKSGSNAFLSDSIERLKSYRGKIAWTDYSRKTFFVAP